MRWCCFYDHFRTDADAPARSAQIGTFSPVLQHGGSNLAAALQTQIVVVSHARLLIDTLTAAPLCTHLHLQKDFGETTVHGETLFNKPKWEWPKR